MSKIATISDEQVAQIPQYIDKWVKAASLPTDRAKAVELCAKLFPSKPTVIFGESTQNAIDLAVFICELCKAQASQLGSQLDSQLDSQQVSRDYYVSFYLYPWAAYYNFASMIGVEFDKAALDFYSELLLQIPIMVFLGNIVIVCEKPKIFWQNRLLHNECDRAIQWGDGTGMYFLDGVKLEKEIHRRIIAKDMSLAEVLKIENADEQAVALKYNPDAIIKDGAKLIDKSDRGNELYLVKNSFFNDLVGYPKAYFVKMRCPTGRTFIEGVDPEFAISHPKADECQAWLCGITAETYRNLSIEG